MGHQKAPDFPRNQVLFFTFWAIIQYGSKSGSGQDPDRDPDGDRTQWSGQHGETF